MRDSGGTWGRGWARVLSACALIVAGLALAACEGPAHHSGSPATTSHSSSPSTSPRVVQPVVLNPSQAKPAKQSLFAPYDETGKLTVSAAPGTAGECFATSIAVPVSGVFRCLAANEILDPCFAPVHESSPPVVTCFADPWSAGQSISVSGTLPEYDPVLTEGDPWGIELTNGVHCVSVTGAIPSLGGVDLTYRCDSSTVAGLTSAENGVLIAHYGPDTGPLSDFAVSVAWRGRSFRIGGTA